MILNSISDIFETRKNEKCSKRVVLACLSGRQLKNPYSFLHTFFWKVFSEMCCKLIDWVPLAIYLSTTGWDRSHCDIQQHILGIKNKNFNNFKSFELASNVFFISITAGWLQYICLELVMKWTKKKLIWIKDFLFLNCMVLASANQNFEKNLSLFVKCTTLFDAFQKATNGFISNVTSLC